MNEYQIENINYDEIISIEEIGYEETIDIEVDGDHLFYCNDILTHNSAAGDVADVTEESIQGGISKIQSADNVLAIIPNSKARDINQMAVKFLKTRDSGGVGSTVSFIIDWSTLTFEPYISDEEAITNIAQNNLGRTVERSTDEKGNTVFKPTTKGKGRNKVKSDDDGDNDDDDESGGNSNKSVKNILGSVGGKSGKIKKGNGIGRKNISLASGRGL